MRELDDSQILQPFDCAVVIGKMTVPDSVESRWRCTVTGPVGTSSSPAPAMSVAVANGGSGASFSCPSAVMIPSRKATEEICPSPTARIDIKIRSDPAGIPD